MVPHRFSCAVFGEVRVRARAPSLLLGRSTIALRTGAGDRRPPATLADIAM